MLPAMTGSRSIDRRRAAPRAPVTGALVFLMTGIFAAGMAIPELHHSLVAYGVLESARQTNAGLLLQFLSYAFVHASLAHWLMNATGLLILGTILEPRLPMARYLGFLGAAAILSGFGHVVVYPASPLGLMGASGVVSALIGALLITRLRLPMLRYALRLFAILAIVALTLAATAIPQPLPQPGDIGHVAHVAGLAFRIVWGGVLELRSDPALSKLWAVCEPSDPSPAAGIVTPTNGPQPSGRSTSSKQG